MPRFAFDELIQAEDEAPTPDPPLDDMMADTPKLGSLFQTTTTTTTTTGAAAQLQLQQQQLQFQQHASSSMSVVPSGRASLGGQSAMAAPTTPSLHRPISRRIQSAPRPSGPKPTLASSPFGASPMHISSLAPSSSPAPHTAHRAPQPVAPSYPSSPSVPIDAHKTWRQDSGLFLGRSFRVCFGPNGEIYAPSSVRSPEQGGGGVHKVKVTNLSGTCFKEREYGELLNAHREVRAAGEATFGFSSAAQGGEQSDGKAQMSHALSCYADACSRASDTGGSRQQAHSVFGLLAALSCDSQTDMLDAFSSWLQKNVAPSVDGCLRGLGDRMEGGTELDELFVRLTGRQIDEACEAAVRADDVDLALLVAMAGDKTSLSHDMQSQLEYLLSKYGARIESNSMQDSVPVKLMQIYRLLAGDIDELLRRLAGRTDGESRRIPGGELLDWKRCLALYLWYQLPDETNLVLPPDGMHCKRSDVFDSSRQRFSVLGAFQYFTSQLRQSSGAPLDAPIVSHPWPQYLESPTSSSSDSAFRQPSVLRALHGCVQSSSGGGCAQLPPSVQSACAQGTMMDGGREPGWSVLRRPQTSSAATQQKAPFLRESWPVDINYSLIHLIFPHMCGSDTTLASALRLDSHSSEPFDHELAWHIHQAFEHMLSCSFPSHSPLPPIVAAARRSKLTPSQRCLISSQFAAQLEAAGQWQAACYVVLSSSSPSDTADTRAHLEAFSVASLRGLLQRNLPSASHSAINGGDAAIYSSITVPGIGRITSADIASRLSRPDEEVRRWFAEARAWRTRYEKRPLPGGVASQAGGASTSRRIFNDAELALCLDAGDYTRAHSLVLDLLVSDDVESPSSNRPPERTLSILRRLSAGMIKTLNADTFDKGAGPILELMEIWEQLVRLEEQGQGEYNLGHASMSRLASTVHSSCMRIALLPVLVQRSVIGLCVKVSQSLWSYLHLTDHDTEDAGLSTTMATSAAAVDGNKPASSSLITQLHLPPGHQLALLQQLAAKTLASTSAIVGNAHVAAPGQWQVDEAMEFDTEEC